MKKLNDLKPTGDRTVNTYCGLLQGYPMRLVAGCGAEGVLKGFTYRLDGYQLWSSVSLCEKCEAKALKD